jgi:hypothetical protein
MRRAKPAIGIAALLWACGGAPNTRLVVINHQPLAINHRPNDAQCSEPVGPGDCGCVSGSCSGSYFMCTSDSDCTQGVNGRCDRSAPIPVAGCGCTYDSCTGDSDCPSNQTCACHGSADVYGGNYCIPGNCRIDLDCGVDGSCSPSGDFYAEGYYCHTPQDTCVNDVDCACPSLPDVPVCAYSGDAGQWQCECVPRPESA